jgi:hypothetical protein
MKIQEAGENYTMRGAHNLYLAPNIIGLDWIDQINEGWMGRECNI